MTDLHIDKIGEYPLSIDTRENFLNVLHHVKSKPFDLMIIAGDLCNKTGNSQIYEWVKDQLQDIGMPVKIISGNHDTSVLLADGFGMNDQLTQDELYYNYKQEAYDFIFLDTAKGEMSDHQWEWLEASIEKQDKNILIFMHHPPVYVGAKHMEPRYMFSQMERFQDVCSKFPGKKFYVFTGHYHLEKTIIKNNINVYITPSTFVQIDPDHLDFRKMNTYIGYREITLNNMEDFNTNIWYLPSSEQSS